MITYKPYDLPLPKRQGLITASVAPRPICFASTVDGEGKVNLAPYSFFNAFSADPPIMVFSSNRSGRTGETKHTYKNIKETMEVVINVVSYGMVQQMSLASSEYAKGVNEFDKAGFTELASEAVTPPRVKESPVQYECKVNDIIELGQNGGAGNLFICEIQLIHVSEDVLDENGRINQEKIDLVGRAGGSLYSRVNAQSIFEVPKPGKQIGIGVDSLPETARNSTILTGNDLGLLAGIGALPTNEEVQEYLQSLDKNSSVNELHQLAKDKIAENKIEEALKIAVIADNLG